MKKAIIIGMCTALVGTGFTSCLDVENERFVEPGDMVTNDSAFYLLSVLNGMKSLCNRLVLLGELRGDLMATTDYAAREIRQIDEWTLDENTTNRYLSKTEYYSVINQCNYIIKYGAALPKEQAVATVIRAWTYLQLALNYGEAAYYEDFLDSEEASYADYPKYDLNALTGVLIPQVEAVLDVPTPDYGTLGTDFSTQMLNARFVLGDLYLWRGANKSDYERAAQLYYSLIVDEYPGSNNAPRFAGFPYGLFSPNNVTATTYNARFYNNRQNLSFMGRVRDAWGRQSYGTQAVTDPTGATTNTFILTNEVISDIRYVSGESAIRSNLDSLAGIAIVSTSNLNTSQQLEEISLTATRAMSAIFSSTPYTYYSSNKGTEQSIVNSDANSCFATYLNPPTDVATRLGDLRLDATYTPNPTTSSSIMMGTNMYPDSVLAKYLELGSGSYNNKTVSLYRTGSLYLRYAEAVNRAGKPGLAMIALKYGLNRYNVRHYMPASEKLSIDDQNMTFALYIRDYATNGEMSWTTRTATPLLDPQTGKAVGTFAYDPTESRVKASLPLSVANQYLRPDGSGYRIPVQRVDIQDGETQEITGTAYFIGQFIPESDPSMSFYCFKDTVENYYDFPASMDLNVGLHWRGAGCAALDTTYMMPNVKYPGNLDMQQQYMDSVICNEYALETAHEGGRFYDLMRLSKHRQDPNFLMTYLARKYDQAFVEELKSRQGPVATHGWDYSSWYLPEKTEN